MLNPLQEGLMPVTSFQHPTRSTFSLNNQTSINTWLLNIQLATWYLCSKGGKVQVIIKMKASFATFAYQLK